MEQAIDKVGYVKEFSHENNGVKTVIHGIFVPKAMAPMHFHTDFNESFEILEGELSVWNDGKKIVLKPGDRSTVQVNKRHRFKNESDSVVKVLITTEPGYPSFEQNIQIMMGLQKDGLVEQLSKMTPKMIPTGIILTELSNTNLVGATGIMFKFIRLFYSKKKVAIRKEELIEKYCSL